MRIVIVSDTHGRNDNFKKLMKTCGGADAVVHLGDVYMDANSFRKLCPYPLYIVRGNGDFLGDLPKEETAQFGKYKCLLIHGHDRAVYRGALPLFYEAKERGFDVVMFGHTHRPSVQTQEGVTVLNPGSLSFPRQENGRPSWILMDIDDKGEAHYNINYLDGRDREYVFGY
ncbi:MAG: metallophosphoesterase [Lachnospiraceae bacterium]|nr:metallophosphoesterase [Lachnospiraceae bacterium]